MTKITYRTVGVDGMKIFYREAGPTNAPTLLLLHGFPTSSHMFRNLIPLLADRFHIVAPDLPGFGQSDLPSRDAFTYTFARLAEVIGRFTEVVKLKRFAIYIFDYGAPVGLRIALTIPATSRWKRIVQKLLPPFATSSAERQRQQPEMARRRQSNKKRKESCPSP
jgi:pimeloyl-ACP methyl ester carboxylesterase